jgi:hypothetical protein
VVGRYQGQWTSGGRYLFPSLSTPGDYEVRLVAEDNTGNASDPVRVHVVRSIGMNMPGQVNRSSTYSLVFAGEVPANIELRLIQNDTGTTTTVYSGPRLYNWNVSPSALGLTAGKSYTFVLVNRATGYGMGHSNSFYVWSQVGFTNPKAGATLLSEFAPHMVSWNQTYGSFDLAWSTNGTTWTKVGTGTGHSPLPALPSSVYGKVYLKVTDTQYSGNSATTWVYYY